MAIESHTVHHLDLRTLAPARLQDELVQSRDTHQRRAGGSARGVRLSRGRLQPSRDCGSESGGISSRGDHSPGHDPRSESCLRVAAATYRSRSKSGGVCQGTRINRRTSSEDWPAPWLCVSAARANPGAGRYLLGGGTHAVVTRATR